MQSRVGKFYRNWFHLHSAGLWEGVQLGYPECLWDPRLWGRLCFTPPASLCFCLTFPPPSFFTPPRKKSVWGAQISPLKKLRRILEMSPSRIAGLLDLNLRS